MRISLHRHFQEMKNHFCSAVCCNLDNYDIDNDNGNDIVNGLNPGASVAHIV